MQEDPGRLVVNARAAYALVHIGPIVALSLQEGDAMARLFGADRIEGLHHVNMGTHRFICNLCNASIGNTHATCGGWRNDGTRCAWAVCSRCIVEGTVKTVRCPRPRHKKRHFMVGRRFFDDDSMHRIRLAAAQTTDPLSWPDWEFAAGRLIDALRADRAGHPAPCSAASALAAAAAAETRSVMHVSSRELRPTHERFVEKMAAFMRCWRRRIPIVVHCKGDLFDESRWTPQRLLSQFSTLGQLPIVNCRTNKADATVSTDAFFRCVFPRSMPSLDDGGAPPGGGRATTPNKRAKRLKLRDWPPKGDFAVMLPTMLADFIASLPLRDMCAPDGALNLAASMPAWSRPTDLGPKVYMESGTDDATNEWFTKIHQDMSDAANITLHVDAFSAAGAEWTVWGAGDRARLSAHLKRLHPTLAADEDPIMMRSSVATVSDLADMAAPRHGADRLVPWRITQGPGDVVFVPGGCPHQVRNLRGCFKIAVDFVSPEGLAQTRVAADERRTFRDEEILQAELVALSAADHMLGLLP